MTKKRKLNSTNPKYNAAIAGKDPVIEKKMLIAKGPNKYTKVKFKVYGVFLKS